MLLSSLVDALPRGCLKSYQKGLWVPSKQSALIQDNGLLDD